MLTFVASDRVIRGKKRPKIKVLRHKKRLFLSRGVTLQVGLCPLEGAKARRCSSGEEGGPAPERRVLLVKECLSGALHLQQFRRMQSSWVEEAVAMETIFHSLDSNKVKGSVLFHQRPGEHSPLCSSRTRRCA